MHYLQTLLPMSITTTVLSAVLMRGTYVSASSSQSFSLFASRYASSSRSSRLGSHLSRSGCLGISGSNRRTRVHGWGAVHQHHRQVRIVPSYIHNNNDDLWPSTTTPFTSSSSRTLFTSATSTKLQATSRRTTPSIVSDDTKFSDDDDQEQSTKTKKQIPTILLAGFLGSGKTTTLKHLLENNSNIKIGTVVNDVASINIDAKLISSSNLDSNESSDSVELQNGCACCSLADELFTSIMTLTQGGERELDAIVVELSGVADPMAVRDNWIQAESQGHPATKLASLERTITLVDACTFGTDWMSWDTAMDRPSWTQDCDMNSAIRKVPELLAEQVEAADLLLVNKIDLAGEKQVGVASGVARGLNDKAPLLEVEYGKVDVKELLGKLLNDQVVQEEEEVVSGHSHDHHEHSSSEKCTEPDCTDTSHSHSHDHSAEACSDPDCTDTSHSHSHDHSVEACSDPDCNDSSHSHSHSHSSEACVDPDCNDTSHDHSHSHSEHKSAATKTAADQLGITSFVYKSSTPFNSQRLLALLNQWPVPIKEDLDFDLVKGLGAKEGNLSDETLESNRAFVGVLRSKGFCWMSPTQWSDAPGNDTWRHDTAMYWSHAGKHFGISTAGKWWGSLTKEQMKPYFANNMKEYDRIMREDWVSEEWGDRRQELVFIGSNLDEDDIRKALDECLCTDEEMDVYRAQVEKYLENAN